MEIKISICKELSLAPETSVIPMKSWWKGASCHKEFCSRRVVAVGVNSIWEEINFRKIIPPGFIMILLKESSDCYWCQTNRKPCFTEAECSFQSLREGSFPLLILPEASDRATWTGRYQSLPEAFSEEVCAKQWRWGGWRVGRIASPINF